VFALFKDLQFVRKLRLVFKKNLAIGQFVLRKI